MVMVSSDIVTQVKMFDTDVLYLYFYVLCGKMYCEQVSEGVGEPVSEWI